MRESKDVHPFVEDGLKKNEFIISIGGNLDRKSLKEIPTLACISLNDFLGEDCNADKMIRTLKEYAKKGETLKCAGLREVQDMSWAQEKQRAWFEYEAQINVLCSEYKMTCICFYDTSTADILLGALRIHPLIITQDELCRNIYYIPPEHHGKDSLLVDAYLENVAAFHHLEKTLKEETQEKTKQLQASEKKYRTLVEHVPDVVYSLDRTGHFIEINPALSQMLGYSRDELLGKHFALVVDKDDLEKASQSFKELVEGKKDSTIGLQLRLVAKDGNIKIGELNARALYNGKGHLLKTEGIVRDITHRKLQEENLELLAGVVENVMEAVLITDTRGIITYVNPTACTMFKYSKEELEGSLVSILNSGNSQVIFQEIFKNIKSKDWEGEILAIRSFFTIPTHILSSTINVRPPIIFFSSTGRSCVIKI